MKIDALREKKLGILGRGRRSRARSVSHFEPADGCADGEKHGCAAAFDQFTSEFMSEH